MQLSGNALVPIRTPRLALEPVTLANTSELWNLMRSPHLRDFQDIPKMPLENFRDRVAARPPKFVRGAVGRFEWLMYHADAAEPIGWISVRTSENHPFRGELGYTILKEWRRRGFGTEAVRAVIEASFTSGVVDGVDAYCLPENVGSRGILQQVGLQERRRLRRGAVVRGKPVDILLFELDAVSWRRNKRKPSPRAVSGDAYVRGPAGRGSQSSA